MLTSSLNPVVRVLQLSPDHRLLVRVQPPAQTFRVGYLRLQLPHKGRELVKRLDALLVRCILCSESLSFPDHGVNLVSRLGEGVRDDERLGLAAAHTRII